MSRDGARDGRETPGELSLFQQLLPPLSSKHSLSLEKPSWSRSGEKQEGAALRPEVQES